ncbi:MAG TPA: FAD-dependent monooxygenase, partial [Thermoanaerobaculia bacterium]|nr:FAD-dependent monooxygenase [Thermoanaerobaculia bacterium]
MESILPPKRPSVRGRDSGTFSGADARSRRRSVDSRAVTEASVLIVGAGPTGLVLALWLTKLGVRVRIVDAAAGPGTTSRALAVQARTLEFYGQAGLADAVVEAGRKVENLSFWVEGRRKSRMSIGRIGEDLSPYSFALVYPQDAHERLLIERLEAAGVAVERNTRLVAFDQDGSGVRATLRRNGGAEESVAAEWLAGCDGASSTVRQELGIGFPGGTYTGQFYVADVEAAGPSVDGDLHIDLEDADFLLMFPMRGSGSVRLVGVADAGGAGDPTFDEVAPRVLENLRLEVRKVNWFSTYRVHHRVADRFRAGRAFLLGDAAHIHSPVGGQGMNTGIGDAVNLAWKLAAVGGGRAREALLATYEPERIAFARRLVATTDRIFSVVTRRGALARIVRTRVVPVAVPWLFRFAPVRRFQFRTISQIGIEYRRSALSEGSAGRVHGGDRLPWVRTGESEDNFAPLA